MVYAQTLLVLLTSLNAVFAVPSSNNVQRSKRFLEHTVHEERSHLPANWKRSDASARLATRAAKDEFMLPVRINLVQNGVEEAHNLLMEISNHESPRYSDHLTPAEVAKLFAPSAEAVDAVLEWLADSGLAVSRAKNYDSGRGAVTVSMPMSHAEDLLKTTYSVYEHGPTNTPHVACTEYSVPKSLAEHIDFITPTTHFDVHTRRPRPRRAITKVQHVTHRRNTGFHHQKLKHLPFVPAPDKGPEANVVSGCDKSITPGCLKKLYGINYTPTKNITNAYGIVEYTPQSYVAGDLDLFFGRYAKTLVGKRPSLKSIDGGVLFQDKADQSFAANGESDLDLEYAMALVAPTKVNLYQVGDAVEGASFNNFLDALDASYCSGDDSSQDGVYPDTQPGGYKGAEDCGKYSSSLPKVVSTSYGYNEVDLTKKYEMRQCNEYMKFGLLGITFVYSSGDNGVAGNNNQCIDVKTGQASDTGTKFNPAFPSTCSYITSIGATEVYPGKTYSDPEGAANKLIYSGGGFSNNFPLPSYQSSAVGHYFSAHRPSYKNGTQYNGSGNARGYPDMAANGVNYVVAVDGTFTLVYGTSAAAPVVGAIFALINDKRAAAGKKSIGFVNPTLYANPTMFNDIKFGSNPGCNTTGFKAEAGWDPVTGLGTPKFQSMMDVFTKAK